MKLMRKCRPQHMRMKTARIKTDTETKDDIEERRENRKTLSGHETQS